VKTFGTFIVGLVTVIGVAFAIYQGVKPSGPPSFSGEIGHYDGAGSFISFLSQHDTQRVNLDVTCIEPASQAGCIASQGTGNSTMDLRLYASSTAAHCWNGNSATCSGGALINFVIPEGVSGTISSPGAGYYTIKGNWIVRDQGSGGSSPEGDETYELDATN
jgi:hypothetical protein